MCRGGWRDRLVDVNVGNLRLSAADLQTGRIAAERIAEGRARPDEVLRMAELPAQFADRLQIVPQQPGLVQANRFGSDGVRDVRVSVAVAADPRTEAQERRNWLAGLALRGLRIDA